jgi:hypothetical protein
VFLSTARLVGFNLALLIFSADAANTFVPIELPHGVHIELPANWTALSDNKRTTLSAYTQARVERLNSKEPDVEMPFAASLYDDAGLVAATMNIRYYPALPLSQSDASRLTAQDVTGLDQNLQKTVIPGAESSGQRVLAWHGTKRATINSVVAFLSEYRVSAVKGGPFIVRLVRVFNTENSFTLILSYREDNLLLEPIIDRVIRTLQVK